MVRYAIILLICSIFYRCTAQDKVTVSLYYESLRPDSINFITKQLVPGFQKVGNSLNLDLVPYGRAQRTKIEGQWQFECQHGPKECTGNKIQACVIKHYSNTDTQLDFVGCVMNSTNPASAIIGEHCANRYKISWRKIKQCVQGPESGDVLARFGERTDALGKIPFIPEIVFNGAYNQILQDQAIVDFVGTVCRLLKTEPSSCSE